MKLRQSQAGGRHDDRVALMLKRHVREQHSAAPIATANTKPLQARLAGARA